MQFQCRRAAKQLHAVEIYGKLLMEMAVKNFQPEGEVMNLK